MGRQVAFYMTAADEEGFLRHLRERGDVAVLPHRYAQPGFPELPALPTPWSDEGWYIVNLVPRSDLGELRYRPVKEKLVVIDIDTSPVVEWVRSMQRGPKLKEGRFWISGTPATTMDRAVTLYEDLRKWLRKNYARSAHGPGFIGPDAERLVAHGGQLIFMQDKW